VDAGPIWAQSSFTLRGDELLDEINEALFSVEFQLMNHAIDNFESIRPRPQSGDAGSYYRRRTAADSRVDPFKSLAEQFELLRVVDPDRYPAFFDYRGCRYKLVISKMT
jgi:methionyl-tRNA formyltransferase